MKTLTRSTILAALLFLLSALSPTPTHAEAPAELILSTRDLQPTTTFEIRFRNPVVRVDSIGKDATNSPLVIKPHLDGTFRWISTRSGIFTPAEALPLAMTYQLTIRRDSKDLEGHAIGSGFREIVRTPNMEITGHYVRTRCRYEDASATPQVSLVANAFIDAGAASRFCHFEDAAGDRVPAIVELAAQNTYFPRYRAKDKTLLTWGERARADRDEGDERKNHVVVSPIRPLPPGKDWKLLVAPGLPSPDPAVSLARSYEVEVGTVKPFEVTEVRADNALKLGKRLGIEFSKRLSDEITKENFERWITVSPRPADLHLRWAGGSTLELGGDFELHTDIHVEIAPGIRANEPFVLAESHSCTVQFEEIPARLYFEEFQTHQLSSGSRKFHLVAVNTPRIRLSAKLFQPDTAALATEHYQKYLAGRNYRDPTESYGRLDPDEFPGRTILTRILEVPDNVDEPSTVALDWDEILGAGASGVVLLTAESLDNSDRDSVGVQALVQVTDLAMLWKQARNQIMVHVFSMQTGKALPGADVLLLDNDGDPVLSGETDAQGIAILPIGSEEPGIHSIVVSRGEDIHTEFIGRGQHEIALYRFGIPYRDPRDTHESEREVMFFSDRPVYKPGETVHLKAILRERDNQALVIPSPVEGTLRLFDGRGRILQSKVVSISPAGSLASDFALPAEKIGGFRAELSLPAGERTWKTTHYFQVQEYQPNAFEIAVQTPRDPVGSETEALEISAQYYMGKPLSAAKLHWSIQAEDTGFAPAGFEHFSFCTSNLPYQLERRGESVATHGTMDLTLEGTATVMPEISLNVKAPQPRSASVLCEITDLNQQTVSNRASFTIHSSSFYLGLKSPEPVTRVGDPIPLDIVAVGRDGKPWSEPVTARVTVSRIIWQTNAVVAAGGARTYRTTPRFERVLETTVHSHSVGKYGKSWLLAETDEPSPDFIPNEPGTYLVEVDARDDAARDVLTASSFHVYGEGELAWDYRDRFRVELLPDRERYAPGDTAAILVKTPIEGRALVTVETDKVLRTYEADLKGNAPTVRVPVQKGDGPNVFVSVTILRGADDSTREIKRPAYRMGFCQLDVAQPESTLKIAILPIESPSNPTGEISGTNRVQPGEEVCVTAEITDWQGQPANGAEVTLYAVDEGVLSLMGYETPDPLAFFNRPRPLRVATGLTLPALMSEDPADRQFSNKGFVIGDGGPMEMDAIRKNFVACAYWNASHIADPNGRVQARFIAPDSLTRYRVIAVAHLGSRQFGSAESAFEISKPIMLQPSLPRFARIGDTLAARAVVHNQTDADGMAEIRLELDSHATPRDAAAALVRTIPLGAHKSVALDFPVQFEKPGKAVWKWTARFVGGKDAAFRDLVQSELEVGHPAPLRREIHFGRVEGKKSGDLLTKVSPELLEGTGYIRVSVSNSRLIELWEPAQRLFRYPYGCVEQTTSSMLPWVVFYRDRNALPGIGKTDAEFEEAISRGVNRLFTMQTSSGGFGYWPGATEPMLWGSAYGGLGVVLAKRAGASVPEADLNRLLDWISAQLRTHDEDGFDGHYGGRGPSDRCLALYTLALAGRAEAAYHEQMFAQRERLSRENRALLALAILEGNGSREMAEKLLSTDGSPENPNAFYAASRERAIELLAWSRLAPDSPNVDILAAELFGSRTDGGWRTTQGNAWPLIALTDYLKYVEGGNAKAAGEIVWRGERRAFRFDGPGSSFETLFEYEPGSDSSPMLVNLTEGEKLFTEVNVEAWPQKASQVRQDRGYAIARRYAQIRDDGTLAPLGDPKVGDRVLVTLQIEARRSALYVAVDDALPANLEAVNPVFKSRETGAESLAANWVSDHSELRDDRAVFFCDSLESGRYTIRYLARVKAAGSAIAPPAKIEEMYHPDRFGSTDSTQLVSLPLP